MPAAQRYDDLVIGAGQAGVPLSRALAEAGRRTALVESTHVGGTCINEGCTPTKTMAASARVAYLAQRAGDYGVDTGPVTVDLARVRQRKRDIVESWRRSSEQRLLATDGLDLLMGEARFAGPHTVQVRLRSGEERLLEAERIVVDVGTRPAIPALPGLNEVPFRDSTTIMELEEVPEHLLILGGGYVAVEFGQMFRRFGSAVTIVQLAAQLLPREDADVAAEVTSILREDGLEIVLEGHGRRVAANGDDGICLTVATPDGERTLTGSHLLVAVGRTPNSDRLDPDAAGLKLDERGFLVVNERLETNVPGIWAAGDVKGGPAFTHIAYDDFRILRTNLLEGGAASTNGRLVPYTVFMDPQLGRVGFTEKEARKAGYPIAVASLPMSWVARALETGEPRGLLKAVVHAETDRILGAAVLGSEGGEIMAVLQAAMLGGVTAATLRETVFAHPTLAEALNNLFGTLVG
ncbi:MAG: mercuric reductase [Actinobacteria bacterium]|nr:mercuric reductase [Actinomycetota bacterium]